MSASSQSALTNPHPSETANQIVPLLESVAIAKLDDIGWIRVTGSDRVRWLNGMVTNSVQALTPGQGCYGFLLNAQGQIQGDLNVVAPADDPDSLLIETAKSQIEAVMAHLDRFIIMDDVELKDISAERACLVVAGPKAEQQLRSIGIDVSTHAALSTEHVVGRGTDLHLIRAYSPLVSRFEIWGSPEVIAKIAAEISAAGIPTVSANALEQLRILEGTPRFGTDIRTRDLPQETAQTRALHFNKGCYLGQEIVERIRSRGNVHRTFIGFELTGELPTPGTKISAEGKPVGELTSVASVLLPDSRTLQFGVGYIRREALDRKVPLEYPGGSAAVHDLPYKLS